MNGTRGFLIRRLVTLLALSVTASAVLFTAYYGVSRNTRAVRDASAPAILQVAAANEALDESYEYAKRSLVGGTGDIEGLGEDYRTTLSTANQALAQALKSTTAGPPARQTLLTVTGLVSSYGDLVQQAYVNRDNTALRDAYLGYAETMLRGDDGSGHRARSGDSDILARLAQVEKKQLRLLDQQTSFGWLLSLAWWVLVPAACAAPVVLLVRTQRFLRLRFRRRFNPFLLVATGLLLLTVPTLAVLTYQTQDRLAQARTSLRQTNIGKAPDTTNKRVSTKMEETHWRTGAVVWIPMGGVLLAALVFVGLQPRIDEYRFRAR
ncbi:MULTISPECIES: hypothetical protein [Streptomyces]|uniref:Integral membrane protein n=1 Tax=Streptomyces lonegramiae TaxID=3075524 RepID=A0ABU2XVW0_9ACTN|nr:hypothetical protein [Streptomyces sp. DSM 41529]MDT0549675.1 hypothetical protein [Streptomyces sp. DSM 41529]